MKPQLGFSSYEIKRYPMNDEIDKVLQKAKELEHKLDDGNITENEATELTRIRVYELAKYLRK